jgi:hypothetical protein
VICTEISNRRAINHRGYEVLWGGLYARQFVDRHHGGHKARPTVQPIFR